MARRLPRPSRPRRRPLQLILEGLEGRRLLAANVAVASDAGAASSPLVRLVDAETGAERASVMAYESSFKGGARVAMGRVTGNAAPDLVVGCGSGRVAEVRVFKPVTSGATTTLTQVLSFRPFGDAYRGGIEVAVGDVDGDSTEDIIVSKSREGGDVRIYRMTNSGGTLSQTLYATIAKPFGPDYNGGSSVGVADVGEFTNGARVKSLGDNKVEILVGTGAGLPGTVRVYDISRPTAPRVADTIVPFGPLFTGGVSATGARYAATGLADSIDEIVVSAGRGGASQTRIFDGTVGPADNALVRSFATFAALSRPNAPVFMAPVDVDGNGQVDRFLATQGDPGGPAGISNVSLAGVRAATPITSLAGPLRIAAARTAFATQSIQGTVKTPSPTSGVAAGASRTMKIRDIVTGTGTAAATGDKLTVQYTGMLTNGTVFDTSRQAGRSPFQLTLGSGQVIPGWEAGLVGMQVGGRRLLEIPPELAYGDAGSGSSIPGRATLFFDVELVSRTPNSPATISGTSTGALTEDAATTVASGTLSVADADAGQATFATPASLAGTYGTFAFNPATGVWNYTLDNARPATQALAASQSVTDSLTVTSRDGTASRAIVVTLTGANETPTNIALSASTVADDSPAGTIVGTLSTTDTDAGDTFTYTLVSGAGDTDNASFSIAGASLKTATVFNFETKASYSVRVRSTDAAGAFTEKQLTVTVTDLNEAPSALSLSALTVAENAAAGTVVGTLSTTDGDPGSVFTYTLVSGAGAADNASFTIVGDALKTAAVFDAETKNSYSIRVRSTDSGGLFIDRQFTITVTNVNEAPTNVALSAASVAENSAVGTVVGTLSATDVDPGDTFTYTLVSGAGDTDNAFFTIAGSSLKTNAVFNFETQGSYSIRIRATDQGSLAFEKPFTITVTNVNDLASISGTSTASLVAGVTSVASGTLSVTDGDAGEAGFATPATLTSLRGSFTFNAATGAWTYTLNPDLLATAVLTSDRTVTDSLNVTSLDGTASRSIDVSITGYTMQSLPVVVPSPSPSAAVPAGSTSAILYREYAVGTGAVAEAGKLLTVNYYGLLTDDTLFDSSYLPGRSPFQFVLGAGQVITGWDQGVAGMKVGGLRVLSIPPELAYGDTARPSIPAGSRLVFVVELLDVETLSS